jgi:hypothetical protein
VKTDELTESQRLRRTLREEFAKKPLRVLRPMHVRQIDNALRELGLNGEVRLIKNKGELRFITTVRDEEIF